MNWSCSSHCRAHWLTTWIGSLVPASLLWAVRSKKTKANLFVCYFIFMYFLLFNSLTDSLSVHCPMSSHQAHDLNSPIIHFHHVSWAFCGCPLFTHYIVLWWINLLGILGHLNPSLTEFSAINNWQVPMLNASTSEDVDFWQLLPDKKKKESMPSAVLSSFHLSFSLDAFLPRDCMQQGREIHYNFYP